MGKITVPTTETVAMSYCMKAPILVHHPIMLIGLAGCGKTQSSLGLLKSLDPSAFTFSLMNRSYYTDSTLLQSMLEAPLEKKAGKLFAPPGKLQMIYFVDDLNMPQLDKYNTQSAIELMKQKQDYGHWYDRSKITIKDIGNSQYLCCMNPTAGSFKVNQRMQRNFWCCAVPFPEQGALLTIYQTFMKGHFDRLAFKSSVQEMVSGVIRAGLSLHENVTKTFRKTAANLYYEFNIRHMSNVFGGLLSAKPSEFADGEKIVLLWMHESERIYGDRLVSVSDLKKYEVLCFELCKRCSSSTTSPSSSRTRALPSSGSSPPSPRASARWTAAAATTASSISACRTSSARIAERTWLATSVLCVVCAPSVSVPSAPFPPPLRQPLRSIHCSTALITLAPSLVLVSRSSTWTTSVTPWDWSSSSRWRRRCASAIESICCQRPPPIV